MRILALLPSLPFPADTGQKHRFSHLLREVARREQVALICFADEDERRRYRGEHDQEFAALRTVPIARSASAPSARAWLSREPSDVRHFASPAMREAVDDLVRRFQPDVLLCGDPALTRYVLPHGKIPRILDYVCEVLLQTRRMQRLAHGPARALWALRRAKYARFLRNIRGVYDLCLLNSREDLDSLREVWPTSELVVLPNGLPLDEYARIVETPVAGRLIYPGSVTYPPNRDAVAHFAARILPAIRASVPEAELHVTGAAPASADRPAGEGVVYTGYLPDVRRAIAAAWACVVPLRLGAGGARLKVLEAMALGTPMVATAVGYEGVAVTDGRDILAADDPDEFARRTVALLRSPELRARIAAGGRRLMAEHYDVVALGTRYRDLLHGLAARPLARTA